MKLEPLQIWSEYQKISDYLTSKRIYETVKQNEKFYDGNQWDGIKADNMPKPVFNFIQRNTKYMVATLSSNDIGISITPFSPNEDDIQKFKPIAEEVEKVIERGKIKESAKLAIRNGCVDGSAYMMQMFDADYETGQEMKGRIVNKLIHNTNMYFGNPYSNDIQEQPYIIVAMRQHVEQVKQEAELLGVKEDDIDLIKADDNSTQTNDDSQDLCTVLIKYFKKITKKEDGTKTKTVWFTKTTQNVTLIEPIELGYKRYPISCFGWDPVHNSYTYNSPITSIIPNQIFINKCFAIAQVYGIQSAFPKVVYDKNKVQIEEFLEGTSPHAVASLDMAGKFLDFIKIPDFSSHILELVNQTIEHTKECMGVTNAALGNVNPDNTSAIIALQEASNVPLELQRQNYFEFWEDTVRNIIDIMANTYGERQVIAEDLEGNKTIATIDFSLLKNVNFEINVDIGNASQFSEIAQMNTLDKLVMNGMIDSKLYIDSIPSKYIPNKGKIAQHVDQVAKQMAQQNQMALQSQNLPIQ